MTAKEQWEGILDVAASPYNMVGISEYKFCKIIFRLEQNETKCRRLVSDIKPTNEDKAFFSSRQAALEAYTAALSAQEYNKTIIDNIEKIRLELLQFIAEKKQELGLEDTALDFDGNVYFVQISHGPDCKNH